MNNSNQAQMRLSQSHLDKICYQRLQSPDFAQQQTLIQKIIKTIQGEVK